MSAKRLSSKGIRRNSSADSSENLKVVLSERKDSTTRNLVTAAAHRLFSKSCKNEKENVSQPRSKPKLMDKSKESKYNDQETSGTLCPAAHTNGKIDSAPGGRKTTVTIATETTGGLSSRPKPDENKAVSLLNNSKQNAKSPFDIHVNTSKISQQSLGKSRRSAGHSEPKLYSASECPTSNRLVERINGVSRFTVQRHSTKNLASKSKILTDVSQNLLRSTSATSSDKKLPVKPAVSVGEIPLITNAPSDSSGKVGESLKPIVTSLTKNTEPHSTAESGTVSVSAAKPLSKAVTHLTRSASQNAVSCGSHVQKISGHFSGQEAVTRADSSLELDLTSKLNITRCASVDSATCERIGPCETEHNVKNGLKASGRALNFLFSSVWNSREIKFSTREKILY